LQTKHEYRLTKRIENSLNSFTDFDPIESEQNQTLLMGAFHLETQVLFCLCYLLNAKKR